MYIYEVELKYIIIAKAKPKIY